MNEINTNKEEINNNNNNNNNNKVSLEIKIIGWAGTTLLILAFALNSWGYISAENLIYPILNLIAALLLAIRVWADKNWSNLFLEVFWGAIALVSIIKFFIS